MSKKGREVNQRVYNVPSVLNVVSGFVQDMEQRFRDVEAQIWSNFDTPLPDHITTWTYTDPKFWKGAGRDYPPVNLSEDDKNYYVEAAVPGWDTEDLRIKIRDNVLIVSGHSEKSQEVAGRKYIEKKIAARNFERKFKLPEVATDKVTSKLKDGVLTVTLPKVDKEVESVTLIPIETDDFSTNSTYTIKSEDEPGIAIN